jgi:hypothetical protein
MCDSPSQFTTYGLDRPYELSEEHRKDDAPLLNQELTFRLLPDVLKSINQTTHILLNVSGALS